MLRMGVWHWDEMKGRENKREKDLQESDDQTGREGDGSSGGIRNSVACERTAGARGAER